MGSSHSPSPFNDLVDSEQGLMSARVFSDEAVYQREIERIFPRTWLYLGHESEIPNAGDFVTRSMGADSVIVCRGDDGQVRVLLNVCRHRGRKLCVEDSGNVKRLSCPYHGWTYSRAGDLVAVPFPDGYEGFKKEAWGLRRAPKVDAYRALIFASWDQAAEPLADFLGPMTWILDLLFARSEAVEVLGPPMRWTMDTNWKLPAANFGGDGHHVTITHGFQQVLDRRQA